MKRLSSILLNIILDSNDTRAGPVVQSGMNAAFACPVQKEAEAAGSNPARSTIILSLNPIKDLVLVLPKIAIDQTIWSRLCMLE